jgi:hypothetical protein
MGRKKKKTQEWIPRDKKKNSRSQPTTREITTIFKKVMHLTDGGKKRI